MDCFPKCQVCHQYFTLKGPAPFLLPCLHSVCETCRLSTGDGVIACSSCQEEVHLAETHLKKDVVRQREIFHLTVQHCPSELQCTHEDDGNQAVCWCMECDEFLCEYCHNLHESFKATRKHAVKDIGDIEAGKLNQEGPCNIHPKCLLQFWDNDCNILICYGCRLCEHAEHNIVDMDVAAKKAREQIGLFRHEVHGVGDRYKYFRDKITEQMRSTEETSGNLRDGFNHTFQTLRSVIDQREKELTVELEQQTVHTNSHLESKKRVFQMGLQRCTNTAEYIQKALQYSSSHDLLILKKIFEETAQTCNDFLPPTNEEELSFPVFSTEGLDKVKSILTSFGHLTSTSDSPSGFFKDSSEETENLQQTKKSLEEEIALGKNTIQSLTTSVSDYGQTMETFQQALRKVCVSKDATNHLLKIDLVGESHILKCVSKDTTNHLLNMDLVDESSILQCIHLKFDKDRVNVNEVEVTAEGELVNKPDSGPSDHSKVRLVKYEGTTSTVPFSQCGSPQYWEVKTRVGIDQTLTENDLLLEIGVCVEEERDQHHCIGRRHHSCALTVAMCPVHNSICRRVWKDGDHVLCLPDTVPNIPGQSAALHYGVVFDDKRCRVIFTDITADKVMSVVEGIDCSRPMWPMFGVFNSHLASVRMSLVVGNDIDMTEEKKAMIVNSLSQQ